MTTRSPKGSHMSHHDYTHSFTAPVDPANAYRAAAEPTLWWGEMADGRADSVGATFVFDVPGMHYSQFQVTDAVPGERLTWAVVHSANPNELHEWVGTELAFVFTPAPDGTLITFTHKGLRPTLQCHDVCSSAWDHHLAEGLQALLTTGSGRPLTYATVEHVAQKIGARPADAEPGTNTAAGE